MICDVSTLTKITKKGTSTVLKKSNPNLLLKVHILDYPYFQLYTKVSYTFFGMLLL